METDSSPIPASARLEPFVGINLRWSFDRQTRQFVVRVVEPHDYDPASHADLFNATMTELLRPTGLPVDPFDAPSATLVHDRFDLILFPEAFVPVVALVGAISALPAYGPSGCIHVGLRPTDDAASHLFSTAQLRALVAELRELSRLADQDLAGFAEWLGRQQSANFYNIGCLFAVDADGVPRICLHPKLVRSRFETSPLAEDHMHEADLLTLVTLLPVDKQLPSITLQPLICSDALNLDTDRPLGNPMIAINRHAGCFGALPPDHVDIVSIAACTPQAPARSREGRDYREWHNQFRDAFRSAAQNPELGRHHFAAIILANFQEIRSLSGGLSGIFLPIPPRHPTIHDDVIVSCWGRLKDSAGNNSWSGPDDDALKEWDNYGFIAGLDPATSPAASRVRIFGFNIHRLPRETSLWARQASLTQCEVGSGSIGANGGYTFLRRAEANA